MNRESASAKLRAIAQIRIEQHLVSAQTETGEGLPSEVLNGVRNVLCGPHKTFRYMLFTGMGRPIDLSRPCQTLPASMGGNKTPIIDTRLLRNPDSPDWLKRLHARASNGSRQGDAEDRQVRLWYNIGWQTLVSKCDRSVK